MKKKKKIEIVHHALFIFQFILFLAIIAKNILNHKWKKEMYKKQNQLYGDL